MGAAKRKRAIKKTAADNFAAREDLAAHFDKLADEATEEIHTALTDALAEIEDATGGDEDQIAIYLKIALVNLGERRGYRNAATDIRESAEKA